MILYRTPGLSGLELWHALSDRATLLQLRDSEGEYFAGLIAFLVRLHAGRASTGDRGDTQALMKAAGFERVIFCGGRAQHPMLERVLAQAKLPFMFEVDPAGQFAARRGGLRIFEEMGWSNGVALDVGQTQIKVINKSSTRSIPRDLDLLPLGFDALDPATGRARLRDFIGSALPPESCDGVVLGLPVAIDRGGVARPATYPGLCGPIEGLFDGLFSTPWAVVNDAVLAAVGFRPARHEKTLVITLGFGMGGALWHKSPRSPLYPDGGA